jgi:hypothetical protein
MKAILSSTYFGPVQWYQKLNRYDEVLIEHCDSYQKQTFRNRCLIATTNGIQALTVPVDTSEGKIRISNHGNWRHQHWQALTSAYGDSPFFLYYEDDLRPFFIEHWEFLYDFNETIRKKVCELIDIYPKVSFTENYKKSLPQSGEADGCFSDFRETIQPKHPVPDADFVPRRYYQVYERKHGFLSNLSILDLLFNMGPESIFYL